MPRITEINGKPVVYPEDGVVLNITSDHVRRGRRKDHCKCAIAQCALDIKGVLHAAATLSRLYLEFKDRVEVRQMPGTARNQLIGFDRFSEIQFVSGQYYFSPLKPSNRTGKGQGSDTNRNGKSKKKRAKRIPLAGVRSKFNPLTDLK